MTYLRKGCGLGTPHGEHTWECEDWGRVRCPGRDTGDTTGLNAKPCGKTHPHPSHLWDAADATEVFRCFGAMGTGPVPVADVGVSLFNSSGEKIGEARSDDDGFVDLDAAMWTEIGTAADGGKIYASPLKEGRMENDNRPEADQSLPHKLCARETPHQEHNWVWDDRPMTRYFCEGRTFDPDATLHEGNQPGDFILDLSPDIPDILRPKPTDTLPDRSLPLPDEVLHGGNTTPEVERLFREIRETRAQEREGAKEENRALPVKWADRAMFKAEPIRPEEGPKVYLLWMTPDPLGAIAAACKMYKGEVVRDLSTITDDERLEYLAQVNKTKLKAPFEFVQFHFMIEGVTRSFTHQMVRQRTAAYAQESLRFAVVGEEDGALPVALPPSLSGLPEDNPERRDYEDAVAMIGNVYRRMVDNGVPAEDARGLLPHNILTRLNYTTNLRALLDHAGNRLCTQAQFEWRLVFAKIVEAIRDAENHAAGPVDVVGSPGYVKMARELTDLFKPVCYQTGKCEFKANFDRACSIRDRVDANAEIGRPSSEWDKHITLGPDDRGISAIKPGEWLLDPKAARRPE